MYERTARKSIGRGGRARDEDQSRRNKEGENGRNSARKERRDPFIACKPMTEAAPQSSLWVGEPRDRGAPENCIGSTMQVVYNGLSAWSESCMSGTGHVIDCCARAPRRPLAFERAGVESRAGAIEGTAQSGDSRRRSRSKESADDDPTDVPIDPSKLPEAVMAALHKRFPGVQLLEAARTVEANATEYDVKHKFSGQIIDATLSPDGQIIETEHMIASAELPRAVLDWVRQNYPDAEIDEAAIVTEDGFQSYEVLLTGGAAGIEATLPVQTPAPGTPGTGDDGQRSWTIRRWGRRIRVPRSPISSLWVRRTDQTLPKWLGGRNKLTRKASQAARLLPHRTPPRKPSRRHCRTPSSGRIGSPLVYREQASSRRRLSLTRCTRWPAPARGEDGSAPGRGIK